MAKVEVKAFRVYHYNLMTTRQVGGCNILFECPEHTYEVRNGTLSVYKKVDQAGIEVKFPVWRFGPGSGWYVQELL